MTNTNLPEKFPNFVLFRTADGEVNIEKGSRKKMVCAKSALTTQQKELKGMAYV